jgi:hypothetical protein
MDLAGQLSNPPEPLVRLLIHCLTTSREVQDAGAQAVARPWVGQTKESSLAQKRRAQRAT